MQNMMARLGSFTFGIDTAAFQELRRASAYRWEAKNRIGRKPAQQNLGTGEDTISLSGSIYPHYRGGLGQIEAMRSQAASGTPLPLVYAFTSVGQYCGLWCVTSIEETRAVFFDNGAPRRIDFSLSLTAYGEDANGSPLVQLARIASAPVVSAIDAGSVASSAAAVASEAASVSDQAGALSMMSRAAATAQEVAGNVSTAVASVLNSDAVRLVRSGIADVQRLQGAARGLVSAVSSVDSIASNPSTALAALGNLSTSAGTMADVLGAASTGLSRTAAGFNGASSASLHQQQIASATSTMTTLAAATGSIKSMASTLRGFF